MRIVAGEMKGRRLIGPHGSKVRPTADKVKEAVFSMIDGRLAGATVVDLFAGTGGLGLEAISRGAGVCYFGDASRESIRLVAANIAACGAEGRSVVLHGDFRETLSRLPGKADVVFLDPPFEKGLAAQAMQAIRDSGALSDGGVIVCEHGAAEALAEEVSGYSRVKLKKYGEVLVALFVEMPGGV